MSDTVAPPKPAARQSEDLRGLWNIEAEQALLGALLISNDMIYRVPDNFGAEHFYDPLHGRIFEAISKRIQAGQDASPITLRTLFEGDKAMEEVGGASYLRRIMEASLSFAHARDYAEDIYGRAIRRMLIEVAGDIESTARDSGSERTPEDQVRDAEQRLYALGEQGRIDTGFRPFSDLAVESINRAYHASTHGGATGQPTGFVDLDRIIGGLKETDLIIIAGRTSMGKSALAINMAFNVARRLLDANAESSERPRGVAYFSLEMDGLQLINRILSSQSRVLTRDLQSGRLTEAQMDRFARISADLSELPLYVNDAGTMSIDQLCSSARRLRRQKGVDAIFVDYLQLVDSSFFARREGRVQQVAEVSRRLKGLAKELEIPVVALAQLSRLVEARASKVPQLSDLRESGSIEQDADIVLLIHRESYYLDREKPAISDQDKWNDWQAKREQAHNLAKVLIAKHRNGATADVDLYFDETYTQFSDLDRHEDDAGPGSEFAV